jgi:hypothetical protein
MSRGYKLSLHCFTCIRNNKYYNNNNSIQWVFNNNINNNSRDPLLLPYIIFSGSNTLTQHDTFTKQVNPKLDKDTKLTGVHLQRHKHHSCVLLDIIMYKLCSDKKDEIVYKNNN